MPPLKFSALGLPLVVILDLFSSLRVLFPVIICGDSLITGLEGVGCSAGARVSACFVKLVFQRLGSKYIYRQQRVVHQGNHGESIQLLLLNLLSNNIGSNLLSLIFSL